MTATSLLTALLVGTVVGAAGRLVPASRGVPLWLPLAVAVGAATLGTIAARLAGVHSAGVSPVEIVLQVVCAAVAVTLVAVTTEGAR